MDFRHRITKEVITVSGNTPEGRDLAKNDDWERCPPSETEELEVLPPGVQNAPIVIDPPPPVPPTKS